MTFINPTDKTFHPRFSGGLFQAKPTAAISPSRLLVASDIDDTLIRWNSSDTHDEIQLAKTRQQLQAIRPQASIGLITGRNLALVKEIAPLLKGIPVDFLGVKNGQELYRNLNNDSADTWIQGLNPASQDEAWQTSVQQKTGWNPTRIGEIVDASLRQQGFTKTNRQLQLPDNHTLYYKKLSPKAIAYVLVLSDTFYSVTLKSPTLDRALDDLADTVSRKISSAIADATIKCTSYPYRYQRPLFNKEKPVSFVGFSLNPRGITKASLTEHLLGSAVPTAQAVITAGDAYNDREMLLRESYRTPSGKTVPNFPILSGIDNDLTTALLDHPNAAFVERGALDTGIKQQLEKLSTPRFAAIA